MDPIRDDEYRNKPQPPNHILQRIETIKEPQNRLEEQLRVRKQEIQVASREVAEYYASQHTIHHLPIEILYTIHELSVYGQPTAVATLLLVSKSWYQTTIGNPRLWNHMDITFSGPDPDQIARLQSHVNACLIRSSSLPLRIKIDFKNWEHAYGQLEYEKLNEGCRALLESIVGSEKLEITRWEELEVTFPFPSNPPIYLMKILAQGAPALRRLSIQNFIKYSTEIGELDLLGSPVLPALQELDVSASNFNFNMFRINPNTLTSLLIGETSISIATLNTLTSLNRLELEVYHGIGFIGGIEDESTIFLPKLKFLVLRSLFDATFGTNMEFPSLEYATLSMSTYCDQHIFPNLTTKHIKWMISSDSRNSWGKKRLRGVAATILGQYVTASTLEVDDFTREAAQFALKQAQEEGRYMSMTII